MKKSLNKDNNPFRDSRNRLKSQSLFFEFNQTDEPAMYTVKENDYEHEGYKYISLKRLYMEEEDPLELLFARKHLDCYDQWLMLLNNKNVRVHIDKWREELEIQMRSKALKELYTTAMNEGSRGTTAAKTILDRGWLDKATKKEDKTKEKVKDAVQDTASAFLQRVK